MKVVTFARISDEEIGQFKTLPTKELCDLYRSVNIVGARVVQGSVSGRGGEGNICLHHRVQTSSGAHQAFYPMSTRNFHRIKVVGA
jgi:hypothetical protein